MFWVGIEKVKTVDSLLYDNIPVCIYIFHISEYPSNNYLKEICFAYAYIIHPPLDTKHHSYDSIMFKIAQTRPGI